MDNTPLTEDAAVQWLLASDEPAPEADAGDPPSDEAAPDEAEEAPAPDAAADDEPASDIEADEPASSDDGDDLHEYTAHGQVKKATLAELKQKAALADGAHARIQQAVERQKAIEAQAAQDRQQFLTALGALQETASHGLPPPPAQPDPRLSQTNPAAYVKALGEYQEKAAAYQQKVAQLQHARSLQAYAAEAETRAIAAQEYQRAVEMIPDLAQPERAAKITGDLRSYALEQGVAPELVEALGFRQGDATLLKLLHKAWRHDQHEAKVRAAKAPTPTPTPRHVAAPAAQRSEPPQLAQARQLKQALAKGPLKATDAAALLLVPQPRK